MRMGSLGLGLGLIWAVAAGGMGAAAAQPPPDGDEPVSPNEVEARALFAAGEAAYSKVAVDQSKQTGQKTLEG